MKVLVFIATEGVGSTEPDYPYLSCYTDNYSNVSVCPVVYFLLLGVYFNTCNVLDNQSRIQKSDLAVDNYWVTSASSIKYQL